MVVVQTWCPKRNLTGGIDDTSLDFWGIQFETSPIWMGQSCPRFKVGSAPLKYLLTYVVCPIYFPIWWFDHIHLFCGTQLGKSHFGSLRGSIRDNWSKVEGLSISMYLLFDIPPKKSLLLEVSTMSNTKFDPSPCRCTSFVPWLLALLSSGGHGARGA